MTRFVTGGAGFIGANYLFYLRGHYPDDRLVCIDKLTYAGNLSTLAPLLGQPNFRFAKVDICDREAVYGLFEEEHPDVVVNFAAESHVDRSIADPSLFLQTNIIGTSVLMDACRKYGNVRFHQVSTDEVYGDLPLDRPDLLFTEQTPLHTSSPYSSSKAAADLLAGAYGRTYGLPVTISRCSNNYGPYQFPEKLIPLMIVNALADRPLPVYGRGLNVRDWLYVGDHCRAIDLVVNHGRIGEVYNIGGHNEMRNIDIYYDPMPGLGFQTDYYTLKGDGEETFTPDFNYHGFRWVEVRSDRPMKLDENSLTALCMHTAVEPVGEFRCSNDMLNEVWKATRRAYLANLMSIPKNGWTADAALAIDLALLNYDGILFYEKWFDDVADNIREDGRIAGIIPTSSWGYDDWIGPVWDASILIIPNAIYNYYGDKRDYYKRCCNKHGLGYVTEQIFNVKSETVLKIY